MLAPESVQVPEPDLVSAPAPVPTILLNDEPVAVPPSVRSNPEPAIVLTLVRMILLSAIMLLELPRVIRPL